MFRVGRFLPRGVRGVYLFGGTDQYPCVFAHVLHPTWPPILSSRTLACRERQTLGFVHIREIEAIRRCKAIRALSP